MKIEDIRRPPAIPLNTQLNALSQSISDIISYLEEKELDISDVVPDNKRRGRPKKKA